MPGDEAPLRQPINERVTGVVTRLDGLALLSSRKLPAGQDIAAGDLVVRYGIAYLGKPQLSIVPELVIADYGELLHGEEAWRFLMEQSHLYPRADICGWRSDGQDDMPALKQLDFDHQFAVFAYGYEADRQPLARLSALIAADRAKFPARLCEHLPVYSSLDDWRAHG